MKGMLIKPLPQESFRANFEVIKDLSNPKLYWLCPERNADARLPGNRGMANDSAKRRVGRPGIPVPHANTVVSGR